MRAKHVNPAGATQCGQLTLFALFDAVATENPRTQALPADGAAKSCRLPKLPSSGPARGENPTTTALYGRQQRDGASSKDGSPVQTLALSRDNSPRGTDSVNRPTGLRPLRALRCGHDPRIVCQRDRP